jgi:hypothetical protein
MKYHIWCLPVFSAFLFLSHFFLAFLSCFLPDYVFRFVLQFSVRALGLIKHFRADDCGQRLCMYARNAHSC